MMNVFKKFIKYVSSSVLGMVGFSLYILADTFFISNKLGADGLTALNLALPAFNVFMGFSMMIAVGGATRYTILKMQDESKKNQAFVTACLMQLVIAVGFVLVGIFASEPLARLLGAKGKIVPMTATYNRVLFIFTPLFVVENMVNAFTRNDGAPRRAMIAMLAASASNIVMDYVLIFVFELGLFGAALATGIAPFFAALVCLTRKKGFSLKAKAAVSEIAGIIKTGFAALVNEWAGTVVMLTYNFLILAVSGNTGVAAYGIIANIALVMTAIFSGIAQGSQPLISEYYATGDTACYRRVKRYCITTALLVSAVAYVAFYFGAEGIAGIFNSEHNSTLQELAVSGMRLYFWGYFFAGINVFLVNSMAASERGVKSAVLSIIRGMAAVVFWAILLSKFFGMNGIWLSMGCAEALTFVIIIIWWLVDKCRSHKI